MTVHTYLFEAKSIQAYLLRTGRLRDLVGASELVDSLCGPLLGDTLKALAIDDGSIRFSRRAGGSFFAFSESREAIANLAALWPMVIVQAAPGLDYVCAVGEGADAAEAHRAAEPLLRASQSRQVPMPLQATPVTRRVPRTGDAAVEQRGRGAQAELDDLTSRRFRRYNDPATASLYRRFVPADSGLRWSDWPLDLEVGESDSGFPFRSDGSRYIAVVHADGNGLGQLLQDVRQAIAGKPAEYVDTFSKLSTAIADATEGAARAAIQKAILPYRDKTTGMLPARPIVLGGDDLTIIVRADLALNFTRIYLAEFERLSALELKAVPNCSTDRLTACAGIAYIKSNQPFHMAAELAESITAAVKRQAKSIDADLPPSSLGFYRITTAMIDRYGDILDRELTAVQTIAGIEHRYCSSLTTYAVQQATGLAALDDLIDLSRTMADPAMARGPTRQLLGLVHLDHSQACTRYKRWRTLMQEFNPSLWGSYRDALSNLLQGEPDADLPYRRTEHAADDPESPVIHLGPLADVAMLLSVEDQLVHEDCGPQSAGAAA